jgi:tRNA(adenine34) deaminase
VVFAAEDPKRGHRQNETPLHPKTEVVSGVLAKESRELLMQFFKQKRG